ncbi:hypothetical protein ABZ871_18255 [Streptomyces populi]
MTHDGIRWIATAFDGYCLTFARGLEVAELVRRMGVRTGALERWSTGALER